MTLKSDGCDSNEIFAALKTVFDGNIDPRDFLHEDKIRSEKKNYEYKVPKYDRYMTNVLLKGRL